MAHLQLRTKKWQTASRNVKVTIVHIMGPLPLETHAKEYTWQTRPVLNQKLSEPSKPSIPTREPVLSSYIDPVLSRLFKLYPQTSQIPDDWRCAIVTPVAKAPHTTDLNLFRPINLRSVVCNLLEAILK